MKLLARRSAKGSGKLSVATSTESLSSVDDSLNIPIAEASLASPSAASLGTGNFSPEGSVESFVPSPRNKTRVTAGGFQKHHPFPDDDEDGIPFTIVESLTEQTSGEAEANNIKDDEVIFLRHASSFLRVADLQMVENCSMDWSNHSGGGISIPNFHHSSVDPPPGIPEDPNEQWVALDNGINQQHAPMALTAINALASTGLTTVLNSSMWTPDSKTLRILSSKANNKEQPPCWETSTFEEGIVPASAAAAVDPEDHVLVWTGKFHHGLYGSDLPAVRAAAVIHMSPEKLMHLLVDSSRVKEYNAMSLGRSDLLILDFFKNGNNSSSSDENCGMIHSNKSIVTKVMRSESRPPLLRKTLQFTSLFHARCIDDGYLLVSRAVSGSGDATGSSSNNASVMVSEILLGVNVIRRIQGRDDQCLFVTVNHIRSPMVPVMIAKRLGLQAAVNFVQDLRRCA